MVSEERREEIKISHFAIATNESINGHLLKDEEQMFSNYQDKDNPEYKKQLVDSGCYPEIEYYGTGLYLRILWANWRRLRKKHNFLIAPSIGILMTDLRFSSHDPFLFTMVYCGWLDKPKWGQRFWKI